MLLLALDLGTPFLTFHQKNRNYPNLLEYFELLSVFNKMFVALAFPFVIDFYRLYSVEVKQDEGTTNNYLKNKGIVFFFIEFKLKCVPVGILD